MPTTDLADTTFDDLDRVLDAATEAAGPWGSTSRAERAVALTSIADALDAAAEGLVATAREESHLLEGRLRGELTRTTFQLRLFAGVLDEGAYADVRIDHADPGWGMGPRPDLRRHLEPVGPVLVFAASNFPFAFSVAGGDTASALAAGCPVVVKAHPGHPRLSVQTAEVVSAALRAGGWPAGVFALVQGLEAGRRAVVDPRVRAASFTGSIPGGRALFDLAVGRPDPIPFFGELGSVNPVVVTRSAAAADAPAIARGLVDSFTLGAGQLCTKPGLLLAPAGSPLVEELRASVLPPAAPMLNDRIESGYRTSLAELTAADAVGTLATAEEGEDGPPAPLLLSVSAADLLADLEALTQERFGPVSLVVAYDDDAQLLEVVDRLDGQLTATVFGEPSDDVLPRLVPALAKKAGRVLWNQWPTGVSVTDAQQHGGPYPATTAPSSTSVGTAAIARFLRPVAYQNFPASLLPTDLTDNPTTAPRRVDGRLVQP
ncbi:aldehyde dehydrogenase (NADP(+)) [Microlunatus spumicola]|uniref:Aldehyde dehydrogenase (NADP(+)) n=1 Tax=Microlunatus spumicola TaxID=81499 RepID=A0ABP6WX67_9ACTN